MAFGLDPADRSVGADDSVLDLVRNTVRERPLNRREDPFAVLRMNLAFVALERMVESAWGQAVDALDVVGPVDRARALVPVPRADVRGVERKPQAFLAFLGREMREGRR